MAFPIQFLHVYPSGPCHTLPYYIFQVWISVVHMPFLQVFTAVIECKELVLKWLSDSFLFAGPDLPPLFFFLVVAAPFNVFMVLLFYLLSLVCCSSN